MLLLLDPISHIGEIGGEIYNRSYNKPPMAGSARCHRQIPSNEATVPDGLAGFALSINLAAGSWRGKL